ncbi:tektin bundle-interacting protein 1 [Calonectris borealis]|uniref:tektin bundle-interacting protein 1 n=1 Tax=Calonectris borealis TaxID=1323832 RepID=UPI003F4BFF2E
MELGEHRPWVLQSTLETEVPLPLYSDQYVTLWGPRQAPLLKQAVRWKTTPMGWDAVGQSWSTGLSGVDEEAEDPWHTLASGIAHRRWQRAHTVQGGQDPLPPAYAQRLREVAWWDPIVPAAYLGSCTRWGPFLWQERPILGKEYVVTRSQSPRALGGGSGYVPALSFCRPPLTTRDISTWSLLHHQPSTRQ